MNFARLLMAAAVGVAPAARRSWAEGIRAELPYVPAREATAFALGALVAAVRFRLFDAQFVAGAARYGLAICGVGWGLMGLRLGFELRDADTPMVSGVIFTTAAVFGLGGVLTAIGGLRLTARLGTPALFLAIAYALAAGTIAQGAPYSEFLRALAIENVAALLLALLVAVAARQYTEAGGVRL
jgi:hypothetical protein